MSLIFGMLARLSTMARCAFAGDVQNLHRGVILGRGARRHEWSLAGPPPLPLT